jgi:hypothetical protein
VPYELFLALDRPRPLEALNVLAVSTEGKIGTICVCERERNETRKKKKKKEEVEKEREKARVMERTDFLACNPNNVGSRMVFEDFSVGFLGVEVAD